MALDEPKDSDNTYEIDGYKYIVDKSFMEKVQPINVDFSNYGFKVTCAVDFSASGGGCSGCGSSSNCCS